MHKLPSGCPLKMSHVYLKWHGGSGAPRCPTHFPWCFLTTSQSWSQSLARLSVATARGPERHFTTMSVTSTVHTNQRACLKKAQLQRRKRWRNDHGEAGKKRGAVSVSHGASNFGSGSRTTLFHHELLCCEHDLAQYRQRETDKLLD